MEKQQQLKWTKTLLAAAVILAGANFVFSAEPGRETLPGQVPSVVAGLTPKGRLPATNQLFLAIGLPLRNQAALGELLRQLYDPRSTNFHKFLTPQEFTARFGPTEPDYQAVIKFAEANGLTVAGKHPNRVVLDVEGSASNVEQAFHITLRTYRHPAEARDFFAPDTEPSVPTNLSVVTVEGLSDYSLPRPLVHKVETLKVRPLSFNGSGPDGEYAGKDFRNAYAPGTTLNGAGQSVGLLEFSSYYQVDVTNYEKIIGLAKYVPLKNVVIGRHAPSTANNAEVALDIEQAIAIAPGLSNVIVYETSSSASSILSRMANDNLAKQMSSSWTWGGAPSTTIDGIFQQMAAQGQSFFQASGDSDAYTGNEMIDSASQTNAPVDSTNLTCVGGTTLTMNGSGASWSSETVWNYNLNGNPNLGSGGGISTYYTIPYWQTNVSMAANSGSTTFRNIPDVALTADDVFVSYNNGDTNGTYYFTGTSCAAPLWAGFCALINQQSVTVNGTTVGFLNPALYAIANSANYNACFHDITTGNNIGTETPGLFYAVTGYDLCTGLGTPNGTNLINALAPRNSPYFITQPSSQTVTNGTSLMFSATAGGRLPLTYQWLFDGGNLSAGGNVSGATSNVLSITAATTNDSGNYQVIASNDSGSVTSSVAVLTVGFAPVFTAQPTNLTIFSGGNAVLSATVGSSTPLVYQWLENGTDLVNGGGLSGATSNVLTFNAVTTNSSGNYNLFVTNNFGMSTSSVATLTVVLPPTIITSIAANNDGSVTLNLNGAPGYSYVLEMTTNLVSPVSWSPVATNTFGTNGVWQFTDAQATNSIQRFYRLELLP
jgi:subtilase family serine protease